MNAVAYGCMKYTVCNKLYEFKVICSIDALSTATAAATSHIFGPSAVTGSIKR